MPWFPPMTLERQEFYGSEDKNFEFSAPGPYDRAI